MATSRETELAERLDQLRGWATLSLTNVWAHVDPDAVLDSFLTVRPALVDVHRVLVVEALDAVDRYMTARAADDGLRYQVLWHEDRPGRMLTTASGRLAEQYISRTPFVVLNRIKIGRKPSRAMLAGLNYLGRLYGTEAHQIGRQVTFDRVAADLEQAGR